MSRHFHLISLSRKLTLNCSCKIPNSAAETAAAAAAVEGEASAFKNCRYAKLKYLVKLKQ